MLEIVEATEPDLADVLAVERLAFGQDEEAWMVRALATGALGRVRGRVACAEAMDRPEYWRE